MTGITHRGPHLGQYPLVLPTLTDPRSHVAIVTITLQILGQTVFYFNVSIAQIFVSIGTCAAIELVMTFRRSKVIAWPASAMLTGNGIALILRVPGTEHGDWWSMQGWWVFAGTGAIALASKYLIRRDGRHVFNPSNLALVVVFLALGEARADPQVLWWGPLSPGLVAAFVVIVVGSLVITRRVHQGHSALSFWAVFAAAIGVLAASGHAITASWHVGPISGIDYWWLLVTSPEVLVFLFFMITDPKTAPSGRVAQSIYGAAIAVVGAVILATQSGEFGTKVGILAGLVILCPFVLPIERRSPAPMSRRDRLSDALPAAIAGSGASPVGPAVRLGAVVATTACVALTLVVVGSRNGADTGGEIDLSRRDEVSVDVDSLPVVEIDQGVADAATRIDARSADSMGNDLALGLAIEAEALERGDAELAAAGLTGLRLRQATAAIDAGTTGSRGTREFSSLTATVARFDTGPQAPPELAIRATGTVVTSDGAEEFDATFTLVPVDGVHLIGNEYDADGNPVGDQSAGNPDAIEPPIGPGYADATSRQLAGLSFVDITEEAGLAAPHSDRSRREGPAALTGGTAVGDFDDDGDDDVFMTRLGLPDLLYRNDGGVFTDVTASLVPPREPTQDGSTGAMFVDVSGDGVLDLVVLGFGRSPHRLLLGTAGGSFVDATSEWGLPSPSPGDPDAATFSLAAADYDRDGRVDLFIAHSDPHRIRTLLEDAEVRPGETCDPAANAARGRGAVTDSGTVLLRNTGRGFDDSTGRLGIDPADIAAMTPRFADIDSDGWDDLLITGQGCTTTVLRNDRAGGFVDITAGSGADSVETGIGSELIDADGDGELDWFITGVAYPTASGTCPLTDVMIGCGGNHLLINDGDGTFTDRTDRYGVGDAGWAFGPVAADLNLDGRPDLFTATGLRNAATDLASSSREGALFERSADTADIMWVNTGDAPWPVASPPALDPETNAKAAAPIDVDGDGRTDLLVITTDGTPRLYRNVTDNDHRWLGVRLSDPRSSNTEAIGSTVTVSLTDGTELVGRVGPDGSFQSGRGSRLLFGLGDAVPDAVTVRWPDGDTQVLSEVTVGRVIDVERMAR